MFLSIKHGNTTEKTQVINDGSWLMDYDNVILSKFIREYAESAEIRCRTPGSNDPLGFNP